MEPSKYLRFNRAFLLLIGLWRLEHSSTFYQIYRRVMVGYFCLYLLRLIIQLNLIIGKDNNGAIQNAGISMMCVISIAKAFVCMSSGSAKMIETIKERELKIFTLQKEKILEIYSSYVKHNRVVLLSFYLCGLSATVASIVAPILKERFIGATAKRPLPISVWIPFNSQKYYSFAYFIQSIDANFGCHFTIGTNTFLLSLMIFAVGQMKILNYTIRNIGPEDLFEIVGDHLFIIRYASLRRNLSWLLFFLFSRYVKDLNDLMKTLMFLDFAMCSMHLAVLVFKVVVVS